jgi:hypothetical protein
VVVGKSSNVTQFTYNKNEPNGSYSIWWASAKQITTISPRFKFWSGPNETGTVVDTFSGPNQAPEISGSSSPWTEYDVQPDYDPTGSQSMLFTINGTESPYTVKASVEANFVCS